MLCFTKNVIIIIIKNDNALTCQVKNVKDVVTITTNPKITV